MQSCHKLLDNFVYVRSCVFNFDAEEIKTLVNLYATSQYRLHNEYSYNSCYLVKTHILVYIENLNFTLQTVNLLYKSTVENDEGGGNMPLTLESDDISNVY